MKLDTRVFSRQAYQALYQLQTELDPDYHKKASSLVQGLPAYIATWGLHRLSGDANRFAGRQAEDTNYKSVVYQTFLDKLQEFGQYNFPFDESNLLELDLRNYSALNYLALRLAKEWSFWSTAVLGEAEE
jgi:hypothetical protein